MHKETLGFVSPSDGTQTLGALMTGKVDVRRICGQQHAGALHGLLTGVHPVGKHDLLMRDVWIIQEAIGGPRIAPVAHAFRQGCRGVLCDGRRHLDEAICAPQIPQFCRAEGFYGPFVGML